jgi:hypothetical protein
VTEVLGAIGLILPGLFRIHVGLTPLAAAGLVIIMTGATVITATSGPLAAALVPLSVGLFSGCVAVGRWSNLGSLRPLNGPLSARVEA